MNYFRITGYNPKHNYSFIIDSYGMFEKLWQFSSYLLHKGFEIIEVSKHENMIDVNLEPVEEDTNKLFLRASNIGRPERIEQVINGRTYQAVEVGEKIYIPNKELA